MKKEKIFYYEESSYHQGKYIIRLAHDKFFCKSTNGSYHVLQARVMNLSYAQYLRMCRDMYGAEIIGKKSMYPVAYFSDLTKINKLIKALNDRANYILFLKAHPQLNNQEIIENAQDILFANFVENKKNVYNS